MVEMITDEDIKLFDEEGHIRNDGYVFCFSTPKPFLGFLFWVFLFFFCQKLSKASY